MDEKRLAQSLAGYLDPSLAAALAADFIKIRQDYATKTLERASPGKFVETFVHCLQWIAAGAYAAKPPDVDAYLKKAEHETKLPDGLRFCGSRIARAIYTQRNKRNIAHKNEIDPNTVDLGFIHHAAAWIMAELIRSATGITMQEAGALIELIQMPVGELVEEIDGTRLVHAEVTVRGEILILLHSHYPARVAVADILSSMSSRSAGSVRNELGRLRAKKLVHGDAQAGYRLTAPGHHAAAQEIRHCRAA
jgi:hypothetical protein